MLDASGTTHYSSYDNPDDVLTIRPTGTNRVGVKDCVRAFTQSSITNESAPDGTEQLAALKVMAKGANSFGQHIT